MATTETYTMDSVGVYVAHRADYGTDSVLSSVTVYDLSDDTQDGLQDVFSINVSRLDFDQNHEIIESDLNRSASIYMNRESMLMLAREILNKYDN